MFELEYADAESVPAEVKHLYAQTSEGRWKLVSAGEIRTVQDITNVQEGLRKEREDHKETRDKLRAFGNLDPAEVHAKLDRIEELEAAAGGKLDEEKINQIVESRIKSKTAPLERQVNVLTEERDTALNELGTFKQKDRKRTIHDNIRKAATAAKVRDTALDDALLMGEMVFDIDDTGRVVTKDGVGVTPGIEASVWLSEIRNTRPHWWPESQGVGATGGAGGVGGSNPFSHDNWNLTQQGALLNADRSKAEQMARAAGTTVGGPRPEKK